MKNLSRSSCIPVLGAEDVDLAVFSELGEQPVSDLEFKVSMCLQKVPCLAVVQALQCVRAPLVLKNKLQRVGQSCCPSGDAGSVMGMSCSAWSPSFALLRCTEALRTNRGREHSRHPEAVVEDGCSGKARGCNNQI